MALIANENAVARIRIIIISVGTAMSRNFMIARSILLADAVVIAERGSGRGNATEARDVSATALKHLVRQHL